MQTTRRLGRQDDRSEEQCVLAVVSGRGWWKPWRCTAAPSRRRSGRVRRRVDTVSTAAMRPETWRRRGGAKHERRVSVLYRRFGRLSGRGQQPVIRLTYRCRRR